MKKQMIAWLLAASMAAAMMGCGAPKNDSAASTEAVSEGTETVAEDVVVYTYDTPASSSFNIDPQDLVTTLGNYKDCEITLDAEYEQNDKNLNAFLNTIAANSGMDLSVEVTDRDVIQEGDLVLLDYTGYLNDEAFDGGHAENQMIDVSGNCSVSGSGFIPGFTDCLMGAKVGNTVAGNVTFPEQYGNADLAGQETVFEFVIHGIYQAGSLETLTDKQVEEAFGAGVGLSTVADLKAALIQVMEESRDDAASAEVLSLMIETSEFDIPDDYLESRLNEYIYQYGVNNCNPGQTVEEFFVANGTSLEDQKENIRRYVLQTVQFEAIFLKIADLENIEVSDEEFEAIVNSFLASNAGKYADVSALYQDFGYGDEAYGEKYLRDQIKADKAVDLVLDGLAIIYE